MTDHELRRGQIPIKQIEVEYREDLTWLYFRVGEQTRNRNTFPIPRGDYEDDIEGAFGTLTRPISQAAFNTSSEHLESLLIFDAAKKRHQPDRATFRYMKNMHGEDAALELIQRENERIPKTEKLIQDFLGERAVTVFHSMFTSELIIAPNRIISLDEVEGETLAQVWPQRYQHLKQTSQSFETKARSMPGAKFDDEDPRVNK